VNVALIPARGGSKRIPRKNIRPFDGRPIIAYSIDAARDSGLFDRIMVSTDDDEIARVATALGAHVPFLRPPDLSDDHAGTVAVVRHALAWLTNSGAPAKQLCCLYATAPFTTAQDLRDAHALLTRDIDFVFTATAFEFPVQRALLRDEGGLVRPMFEQWIGMRSQDLPPALHDAGQFYWGWPQAWHAHETIFKARARAHELPTHRVQDIDTPEDWTRAELLYRLLKEQQCASQSA